MPVGSEQSELEALLGHRFRQVAWLEQALTHRSFCVESGPAAAAGDNEKLEFLGDAVLGLIASQYLVESFPDWEEGRLSRGRAGIVNAASLCAAARRLRLGEFLKLGRGEEKTGGREKSALLANAYEAILGAIYLDAGLEPARGFVQRSLLEPAIEEMAAGRFAETDHKSALQESLQRRGVPPAEYRVSRESGPDHRKTFVVEVWVAGEPLASGSGNSKKEAEQAAARAALEHLATQEH
jgi:ribonuclease-3